MFRPLSSCVLSPWQSEVPKQSAQMAHYPALLAVWHAWRGRGPPRLGLPFPVHCCGFHCRYGMGLWWWGGAALGGRSQFFMCLPDDIKRFCWAQSQGQGLTSPFIQPSQEPGEGPDTVHTNQAALGEGRPCSAIQPWPSSSAAEPEEAAFRHCLQ